jgi:hypothetical protein
MRTIYACARLLYNLLHNQNPLSHPIYRALYAQLHWLREQPTDSHYITELLIQRMQQLGFS